MSGDVGLLSPVWAGTAAESLTDDDALVRAMLRVEAALLTAVGAPEGAAHAVAALRLDARALALHAVSGGNPVIPLVDAVRGAVPSEAAEWVHRGATSQDVLDTALVLVADDVRTQVLSDLASVRAHLASLADRARSVPVVARTLTQQALPTTLGFRVAGWLAGVLDAVSALRACELPASLGGPVGHGFDPGVVSAFAGELGLDVPVVSWHARRTAVVATGSALTTTGGALGKVAADLLVMAQSEVGEVREGVGGRSSSMAHKANPTQSVLVVSAAQQLPALASVLGSSLVAESERPAGAWHAEWEPLRSMLRLAGGAAERAASYLPSVEYDEDAMARNLERLDVVADLSHVDVWIDRVLARDREVPA